MLFRYIQLWLLLIGCRMTEEDETVKDVNLPTVADSTSGFTCDYDDTVVNCRCTSPVMDVPTDLPTNITILTVEESEIEVLRSTSLQPYSSTLKELTLEHLNHFYYIENEAFANLNEIHTIFLHRLPRLQTLRPEVFDVHLPKLKILKIQHTGLTEVPNFNSLITGSILHLIDLEHNKIQRISRRQINRIKVEQLLLNFNELEAVEEEAFYGSQIATLSLRSNARLTQLHPRAFFELKSLRYIDLSSTSITSLPTEGLREVDVLKVQDTETLKVFPSIYNFQFIREAWLTYPYHCCAFKFPHTHNPTEYARHAKFLQHLQEACHHKNSTLKYLISDHNYPALRSLLQWQPLNATLTDPNYDDISWSSDDEIFHNSTVPNHSTVTAVCGNISKNYHEVVCHPEPDAFNPCEDIMGNWALRVPVWFISLSAIIGNLFVVIVIVTSHFRLTVSKFLMCNLAAADLSIGLHLFLIAVVDACSIGSYFNYAIDWQEGDGCRVSGFLTIFGNVLSVYTLAVITTERWYTITWAIHLNRRLKLSTAVRVMGAGWGVAIFLASMPLVGVSNYSKTSICLPLEHRNNGDAVYLATLLAFNATAFILICIGYGSMYRSIREGSNCSKISSVRSDMTVAKRMALLVFTDFACWAPIAFFGLTALLGYPLITVTNTKILLVFFYPLNSCANPYLYALLTQQYRRDFFLLMGKYGLCKDRAERHRGAIGGVPLPYGSGPQYKRPCSEGILKRGGTGNNSNRSSMMTTMVSVEMPVVRSYSKYSAKADPFAVLPSDKVLNKQNNRFEDDVQNRLNTSENL